MNKQDPHIFFSPHADDVVLSCGGTIHSLVAQGTPVSVIGVFGGIPDARYSAYARHLHAKWHLEHDPITERWREDTAAMNELGVKTFERWNYLEAPYRVSTGGTAIYNANEELTGEISIEDRDFRDGIAQTVCEHLKKVPPKTVLHFPLSLGNHVDHQILFDIGLQLSANGRQVRFYEDYPYAEKYRVNGHNEWSSEVVAIDVEPKIRAACAYVSQVRGLGGSASALKQRLMASGTAAGDGKAGERYWQIAASDARKILELTPRAYPLVPKGAEPQFRDFNKFLKTFRWHDLTEVLPMGSGDCVDLGCGTGRHRATIECRGYRWFDLDRVNRGKGIIQCDAAAVPAQSESKAAVVAWQILEYVEHPEAEIAEAARILEPGGVFCGSVSFLEPVHGRTYYNISPLLLEKLLRQHGFVDIEIKPGLNGFALMLWTWLSRSAIPFADRLAIRLAMLILGPLAFFVFVCSWVRLVMRLGDGQKLKWLTAIAPLEFAGHVLFVARKTPRAEAVKNRG